MGVRWEREAVLWLETRASDNMNDTKVKGVISNCMTLFSKEW